MAPSPTPTFWGDETGADAAAQAMADALNLAGEFPTQETQLYVSYDSGTWTPGDYVRASATRFRLGDVQYSPTNTVRANPHTEREDGNTGWPTFIQIPEPTNYALALVATLFVVSRRRV